MADFFGTGEELSNNAMLGATAVQGVGSIQDHIANRKAKTAGELEKASADVLKAEKAAARGLRVTAALKGTWGVVRKIAGWIVMPLTILVGVFQTGKAVKKKDGHGAAKAAGGTAGSIGGMIAGDVAVGALMGSEVPIFGNIVGAIVGAVIGIATMIFGGWFGSKVADGVVGDTLHKSLNKGTPVKTVPALQNVAVAEPINESAPSFRARIEAERRNRQQSPASPPR